MNKLGIVVGNGLDNVMEHIARLFLHPQCSIVNMPPTFAYYKLIGKWRGVEIINIDRSSTDFSINVQEVIDSLKDNTKIVFLCTPNNPTGNSTSIEEIEQLASSLHEKNCLLFVDHAYIEFVNDDRQDAKHLVEKYPNIIVGYTFSKAFALAGYRVGYALMDRSIKCQYMKVITPFVCSRPSMAAARAALADTEHLQKVLAVNEAGRQQLYKGLTELGISFLPSDTNFILLKNNTHDSCFIVERLMQEGVIVRAMPCVCPYAVRVTIGRDHENTRLLEALAKL